MAKVNMDIAAMVAAFAAKGGTVSVVAQGTRAIESDRTIYAAMREGKLAKADAVAIQQHSEQLWHAQQDAYAAAKYDGWTDSDAQDYAQHAKV